MGFFTSSNNFPWIELNSVEQLDDYFQEGKSFIVFKHSTRCSISSIKLREFEREYKVKNEVSPLFLDLLKFKEISSAIEQKTGVIHQSPQVIFIENKIVKHHASHEQINSKNLN